MAAASNASGGGTAVTSVGNSALYVPATGHSLTRTEVAGTSTTKQFISCWFYWTDPGHNALEFLFECDDGTSNNRDYITTMTTGKLNFISKSSSINANLATTQVFRDIGWYHVELILDTTQAVASDRQILKINGERVTAFDTETKFALNDTFGALGSVGDTFRWGAYLGSPYYYWDGYMAECVRIDGDPAGISTGEYDSTGLYWTPKSSTVIKALTFGNNGFYLDNTTNAQTDASGEAHNFTNNNTVTTTTNTPTNIVATLNPLNLVVGSGAPVLNIGNTRITSTAATGYNSGALTTIPMGAGGKYYFEVYVEGLVASAVPYGISLGISPFDLPRKFDSYTTVPGKSVYEGGTIDFQGSGYSFLQANAGAQNVNIAPYAPDVGQYVQCAFDSSNGKIWYGINNTWYGSGNPSTGANPASTLDVVTTWHGWIACYTTVAKAITNFGTTDYQYTPPTGFGAVTTTAITANTTRTASDTNKYFQTVLYEGNGTGQRVGAFQPFDSTFTVGNSAVFNTSNYLSRTPSSTGNAKTATFSRWVRRNINGQLQILFSAVVSGSQKFYIVLGTGNQFELYNYSSAYDFQIVTTRTFLDLSQWVHFYVAIDTSESTSSDRIKVYINGVQETLFGTESYPSLNFDMDFNTASVPNYLGYAESPGGDVYSAETAWVDGTIYAPSYFGEVDTSTNRWVPKALTGITWGTNGFYQDYADSGNVGDDESGNGNDFTNNSSVVQSTDSPTTNFAVLDPTFCYATPTAGNLVGDGYTPASSNTTGLGVSTGKWYWELTMGSTVGTPQIGIVPEDEINKAQAPGTSANSFGWYNVAVYRNNAAIIASYTTAPTNNQVNAIMLDLDSNPQTLTFRRANVQLGTIEIPPNKVWHPTFRNGGTADASNVTLNFGASSFTYTPPTGFIALSQDNMAGTDQFISAFSWIKDRDGGYNHMLFDRVRGATNDIHSNVTDAQVTNVNTVQRFLEAGVQVGNDVQVNLVNNSYVLWNWMMEATGSGASNTDGSINTISTLVDTTLGMSISKYTGTGSNATVGHGLGVIPEYMIVKRLDAAFQWDVYHSSLGATKHLVLDGNGGPQTSSTVWNNTTPTSSVFSIGSDGAVNASGGTYIAYCFNPSQFNSIGSYVGNGNADGPFAPLINSLGIPLMPRFIIIKGLGAYHWSMYDSIRDFSGTAPSSIINEGNPWRGLLYPNLTNADNSTASNMSGCVGGLKILSAGSNYVNLNGATYVYMAVGTPIIDTDGRIIAGR